ncbi:c-type cytochrome [Flavobacterium gawalongense]|uniref:Cytochrome c n=1 Tax=Flavobacterium gawalongense TaxID=2594432 RepID=A0A553BHA2_9FLAO|nr:cytochrome c [Flavobacterium gawalongense]TRX03357.1 cytochrome c [Flavobacterium gawalongense]TRX04040.1 cytochrome c [Flavobacterium gawalongense]TRX07640.1 cytochrome c [Flavobacterium gawalongense]TRX07847.1 cytochrome c [Flavobacterium gawalongense]TRX23560.1 cytochrome c [Flavobacterium gawalongense]
MKIGFSILIVLLFTLALQSFNQNFDLKGSISRGKSIYNTQCASCHMEDGNGIEGVFPPLAKSDYLRDKNRLIRVISTGLRGPIVVNGVNYDGEMPGNKLTDKQVSDVLNYVRNSWGNEAKAVLPAEIQQAKKATSKDYHAY